MSDEVKFTAVSLKDSAAARLVNAAPSISEVVIEKLTRQELDKRAETATKAIQKLETMNKSLEKDFNGDPNKAVVDPKDKSIVLVPAGITLDQANKKDKLEAERKALEDAFNKAMDTGDQKDWDNLAKKVGGGQKDEGK